jgi:hypothetical protein
VTEVAGTLGGLSELGVEEIVVTAGTLPFQLGDEDDIDLVGEVAAALRA